WTWGMVPPGASRCFHHRGVLGEHLVHAWCSLKRYTEGIPYEDRPRKGNMADGEGSSWRRCAGPGGAERATPDPLGGAGLHCGAGACPGPRHAAVIAAVDLLPPR